MEEKRIFRNIKGDFISLEEEIEEAKQFLAEVKTFFKQKKKRDNKNKTVFTEQMFFVVENGINEIEKIVVMQKIDIDSFTLYRLRTIIKGLREKIDYIDSIEKL